MLLAQYTQTLGPIAGEIRVPAFNDSLGFLTAVDLSVQLTSDSTELNTNNHNHSIENVEYWSWSFVTNVSGSHSHTISVPSFSGDGLTIPGFTASTIAGGGHVHLKQGSSYDTLGAWDPDYQAGDPYPLNLNLHHQHEYAYTRTQHLTGSAMAPFLEGPDIIIINTGNTGSTSTDDAHKHQNVQAAPGETQHAHVYDRTWLTTTVFTFDVNDPPVADAGGPYVVGLGGTLSLDARESTDPELGIGDSISYRWDLDGDEVFERDSGGSATLELSPADLVDLGVGVHTLALRVEDSWGLSDIAETTVVIHDSLATLTAGPNEGNGFISVPVFDQSLGFLLSATLDLKLQLQTSIWDEYYHPALSEFTDYVRRPTR